MTEVLSFPGLGITFTLNRIAFHIGSIPVYWYGLIIAIGVALALTYVLSRARKTGVHPDRLIDVIMGGFIGGILGARIYYVALEWSYYKEHLNEIYKIWNGGIGIYGGIIGGLIVAYFMCRWRKVKFLPTIDLAAMGFLIGQGIGRWGNFVNVEAFGGNTNLPWGMTSNKIMMYLAENADKLAGEGMNVVTNDPVHPCFLYESIWCLIGFIALHFYFKHRKFDGEIFLAYTAWYGLGRFFIEGLRTDSLVIGSIRVSQVLAAVLLFGAMITLIIIRYKIASEHDPEYLRLYSTTDECGEMLATIDEQLKAKPKKDKKGAEAVIEDEAAPLAEDEEIPDDEDVSAINQMPDETPEALVETEDLPLEEVKEDEADS